ncbi:response regulator transcription factor [Amycolatopsis magusensis]|uniref:response regulator transcription factor n=1 Tax=Amycolatopsis magusensis TaxID=882444 RepID=UPI00379D276A
MSLIATAFERFLRSSLDDVEVDLCGTGEEFAAAEAQRAIDLAVLLIPGTFDPVQESLVDVLIARRDRPGIVIIAANFGLVLPAFAGKDHVATLLCDDSAEDLRYAVRKVVLGQSVITPRLVQPVIATATAAVHGDLSAVNSLTRRELDVLELLGEGKTNQEIASSLHLGHATVKSYVSRVLDKLGKRDRVEGALLAQQMGLLQLVPRPAAVAR